MSPRNASQLTLLFFLLWWGPTTATDLFRMTDAVEGNVTAGTQPVPSNHAEQYSKACDATAGLLKIEKHMVLENTLLISHVIAPTQKKSSYNQLIQYHLIQLNRM